MNYHKKNNRQSGRQNENKLVWVTEDGRLVTSSMSKRNPVPIIPNKVCTTHTVSSFPVVLDKLNHR